MLEIVKLLRKIVRGGVVVSWWWTNRNHRAEVEGAL